MAEAHAYQCPVCGAFATADERSCRHCATALATLRCAQCFELNFPDHLHCRGCGTELGLTPLETSAEFSCPDCKSSLKRYKAQTGSFHACERCGGQLISHDLLRALLERREALGRAVPADGPGAARPNPLLDPVRYRSCPACAQMMNRKNFGGASGIIIDICNLHGSFFDAGELPRVLDFVRRGGLARAERQRQAAAKSPAPGGLTTPLLTTSEAGLLDASSLGLDVLDLLTFVVDILRPDK